MWKEPLFIGTKQKLFKFHRHTICVRAKQDYLWQWIILILHQSSEQNQIQAKLVDLDNTFH